MADRFEDLGIAPELVAGVEQLGWDAPAGLQESALPVIRRGNNVVLHASAGSGLVGAYGLGILDRLLEESDATSGPRAVVLVPDSAAATRTADSLARLATATSLAVRAHGPGWADRPSDLMVTTPAAAAAAVRDSALKLDAVESLVVDGLDQIATTGQWDDLETMIDIVPASAQRVICSAVLDSRADGFIERHVRRAMTVPPRAVEGEDPATPKGGVPVRYRMVPEDERAAAVVSLLPILEAPEVAVVCRSQDRADELERALQARGVDLDGDESGPRVLVLPHPEADQRSTRAAVISADVPFDAEAMAELHGRGGAILATSRERAHLLQIARRAGVALKPVVAPDPAPLSPAERVRDRLRGVLAEADLAADLALLEPLFVEHPPEVVAAAALNLARSTHQSTTGGTAAPAPEPKERPAVGKRPGAGAPPPSSATTWTHLFISIGSRDDVSPGDLVGAMTGEAEISGDQVGKIDIRTSHSTVEVATPVADKVISALNGRTLKGRSLRVDYDRKTRAPRTGGGKGGERSGGRRPGGAGPGRRGPGGRSSGGRSGGR